MKEIGGYFELELQKGHHHYHTTPHALKSGRSALHHILDHTRPSLVYIPYYTCDALLEPFRASGVEYRFYSVDNKLEINAPITLESNEYVLYVNYLDLKREYVDALSNRYGSKLIIDCTQAFFMKGDGRSWLFNSCRKFFGVPDGSYLYTPANTDIQFVEKRNENYLTDHLVQRFNGHTSEGYAKFVINEQLCGSEVAMISKLSEYLLSQIDYAAVIEKRRANYLALHAAFNGVNRFAGAALQNENVPIAYPLLLEEQIDRSRLFSEKIFIPTFWQDVWKRNHNGFETDKWLTDHLIPLPIDHRLDAGDMQRLIVGVRSLIS